MARAIGDLMAASGADSVNFEELSPDYNVAPTKDVPVLVEHYQDPQDTTTPWQRHLYLARWGLVPSWAKDLSFGQRTFNARSESVVDKPSFRAAVKTRRAAIPVDGYYEWLAPEKKGERKQPYFVRPKDGSPIFFAGLYEWWKDPAAADDAQWILSTTILTGPSPQPGSQPAILDQLSGLHDRLPLPMSHAMMDEWLSAGEVTKDEAAHLVDAVVAEAYEVASQWEMYPVDPAVGSVRNNGPELIEPFDPTGGQDTLV
jgi:putative SOS response-associated peptidase YedK